MIEGMFRRAAAISWPGAVLSQEARQSMPSRSAPSTAPSMSLVIRALADRMYPPRWPALVMKSLGAAVRTSNATPPACSMARLARLAISSRWLKQIPSWEEEFTTAIFGLVMPSSVTPSASHCARLVAHRDVPGSKLLRSSIGFQLRSDAGLTSMRPWVASTRTQSPVRMTSHGSWSRSVTAGTLVTTAASADLVLSLVTIIATGAVPSRRVLWKNEDHPEDPLALGKTRTLPVKHSPFSSCLDSMMRP